jgi:hypothetical protein
VIDPATVKFRKVGERFWDFLAEDGAAFARAEVFPGTDQWGVRVQDRAPDLEERDLLLLVGRLLVWEVGCTADTVEVVLGRTHERQVLVKVQGEYV